MLQSSSKPNLWRDIGYALLAGVTLVVTSVLGQIATYPNLRPWYAGLVKPSFNPPNWVFAPVWTSLYVLMAFALWRILRSTADRHRRRSALALFMVMLVLNAAWSWMFFFSHSPLLGLVDIVPQFVVIVVTIWITARLDVLAALCLAPLAAWVLFASLLNVAIWRLNG